VGGLVDDVLGCLDAGVAEQLGGVADRAGEVVGVGLERELGGADAGDVAGRARRR
jgi:hypothetical protein